MNTEKELRKWLNRTNLTFVENLDFGLKVWNSIEFVLLTKQEIIFDEFCNNLTRLRTEIEQQKEPESSTYATEAWAKINELLSLRYAAGTVSIAVKGTLIKALTDEAHNSTDQSQCSPLILDALLTTLQNTSMQNYYKSNVAEFTKFIGTILSYLTALLQANKVAVDQSKGHVAQIVAAIRTFVKQTPFLDAFKAAFAQHVLDTFGELSIVAPSQDADHRKEFLTLVQELYFDGAHVKELKQFLAGTGTNSSNGAVAAHAEYRMLCDRPMHVFLSVCEVILLSFRNDSDVRAAFLRYLFEADGKLAVRADSAPEQLSAITILLLLLKKHAVSLNFEVDSSRAVAYLGKHIEHIVNTYYASHPHQVLSLLCATIRLDPLILEFSACQIGVKFMLFAKSEEAVWQKYEEFMHLLIDMYRKWNRGEKFVAQLVKNIQEALAQTKLSKKLKRTFLESHTESPTVAKKRRSSSGEAIVAHSIVEPTAAGQLFLAKLEQAIGQDQDSVAMPSPTNVPSSNCNETWTNIAFAFTPAISDSYVRFISGLVSKPSLVVWKTLLFALKEHVQQLNGPDKSSENAIFIVEITSALLSQYFVGSRLVEQADRSWDAIDANRTATRELLADFGHAILNQEHCTRTMNAFLRLCHSVSSFDLMLWYYRPDSMHADTGDAALDVAKCAQNMLDYLSDKEWALIEERINNFGKNECKINMHKMHLQRLKAIQLLDADAQAANVDKYIQARLFNYPEQVIAILSDPALAVWLLEILSDEQKQRVCELLLQSPEGIETLSSLKMVDSRQFIEILIVSVYKRIFVVLSTGKHSEHLAEVDFAKIFGGKRSVGRTIGEIIARQQEKADKMADKKHVQKHEDEIREWLQLIRSLPVGFCSGQQKETFALLNIAVYQYLRAAGDEDLKGITIDILKAILHFSELPTIFEHLRLATFVALFESEPNARPVLAILFERLCRDLNAGTLKVLDELYDLLATFDAHAEDRRKIVLDMAVMVMVGLSKDKKQRSHLERFRDRVADIIRAEVAGKRSLNELIRMTLPAFVIIVKSHISNAKAAEPSGDKTEVTELIKTFLGHTADCTNADSVKLLNAALEMRSQLNLSEAEIKAIVDSYWHNFKALCLHEHSDTVNKTVSTAIKLIFDYKSTDEWIELLSQMETDIEAAIFASHAKQQSRILLTMAKCQYNKVKGQTFIGFFKNVTRQINMTIRTKSTDAEHNFDWILSLLECYATVLNNVQLPVSVELIDDILAFLTEINIKKINAESFDSHNFVQLLKQMCTVCLHLIMHRDVFIMARVPQFVNVYKDLVQTICWYKSNRSQHIQLDQAEVTVLAENAHNLEKINKCFVKHAVEVKRVAPYLLLYVINLMVSNDRPTTLYSKIKTHIEYICYDLISVCDHRVEGFILRSCNEASKAVYESLHREYVKSFKFKGKV